MDENMKLVTDFWIISKYS